MASAPSALRGACQHGANAAVLIGGPAGIGKTTLLAEICRRVARMSIWVGWSKCDPIEQVCRFLLRSLVSRLAGLPVVWMFASRDDAGLADLG